jgi:hypothetical protein
LADDGDEVSTGEPQAATRGVGGTSTLLRRCLLFGVPLAVAVFSLIHPGSLSNTGHEDAEGIYDQLADQADLFIAVHIVQLFLFGLLALSVWMAVAELREVAAQVARWALLPFLVFYSAFDSLVGIGTGVLVRDGHEMPAADQDAVERLVNSYNESFITGDPNVFTYLGTASWLVALIAAAVAWRRAGAGWLTTGALALAGIVFAVGHPSPTGTIGMAILLVAYWRLEFTERGRREPVPRRLRTTG